VGAGSLNRVLRLWRRDRAAAAPRPERLSLLLFGVTGLVYLLSGKTFFGYDGEIMYRVSESIVLRHSVQIADPIYHFNEPYSPYAIGLSLLMLPFVAIGVAVLHDPRALVTLLEPAITAATVVLLNLLLVELGCSWKRSLVISLCYAFGTLAWYYSGVLFTEPVIALCLVGGVLSLRFYQHRGEWRWLLIAGAVSGTAVLMRWDSMLLVAAPIGLYGLVAIIRRPGAMRRRALELAVLGAPIIGAAAVNLAYDLFRFREALGGPYKADALGFSTPLPKGLLGLWLSPGVGIFVYTPILLMSVIAWRWFYQRWPREALLILGLFLLRSVFFGRYWAWEGGATWGPRHLVPLIPLLLVPVAFLPRKRWVEVAAIALGIVGVMIQVLGQLVPYGLYYGTVVPQLMAQLGYCQGCLPLPGLQSEAVNAITDFDLPYVPLVVQVRYLLNGVVAPAWGSISLVIPLLLGMVAYALGRVRRLAVALDAAADV
jgi:hypothetical protein